MSEVYNVTDIKNNQSNPDGIMTNNDWNKIDNKFKEIMSRDVLKIGDYVRVYHQEKGLIEGKLKFMKDGLMEIQDDEGSFHMINKKYCRILEQDEKIENKSNILKNKIKQNEMKKQQFLTEENKTQLDDLFRDGKSSVQDKCENEKAKNYAKKSMFTLAVANEIDVHPKLVDTYLKEKGYIGGKIIKNSYKKKSLERKNLPVKKMMDMPDKIFATCRKIEKQNLGNDTALLTLTLNSGDNIIIGNILISEILLESII